MSIAIPFAWLLAFLALPLISVATLSLHAVADSIPPVAPLLTFSHGHLALHASLRGFRMVTHDPLYLGAFWNGIENATLTSAGCILIGFPVAFAIARSPASRRSFYVILAILPFWTSFLLRAYAWMGLIRDSGPINSLLLSLG
ncbi:MAG: putrescine ABC transporter permease PotH, partial [Gammaproteobacteria bacterium]